MLIADVTKEYLKLDTLMVGHKVQVVPFGFADHLDGIWDAQKDDRAGIYKYLPYGPPQTKEEYKTLVENEILASPEGGITYIYVIQVIESKAIIGFISYLRINPAFRLCEIGHLWLSPKYRRQNLLDEAVFLMCRHAIEVVGYRRLEWRCFSTNIPSRKMAERNGFVFEGIFRSAGIIKGENVDLVWLSIIDSDWERVKQTRMSIFER